jgi:hypothetical protein
MPVSSMKVTTGGALKSVCVDIQVFWDISLRRCSRDSRRFEGPYLLHIQGSGSFRRILALKNLCSLPLLNYGTHYRYVPIRVDARTKPRVYDRRGHGGLSPVSVVCCWIEVSATGRSLGQKLPSVMCLSVISKPRQEGDLGPLGCRAMEKKSQIRVIS